MPQFNSLCSTGFSSDILMPPPSFQKIEKPLSSLLADLCIPPSLATTILDSDVGEAWLTAIPDFERRLSAVNARKRVKAARDLAEVTEGLRIVVSCCIRLSLELEKLDSSLHRQRQKYGCSSLRCCSLSEQA